MAEGALNLVDKSTICWKRADEMNSDNTRRDDGIYQRSLLDGSYTDRYYGTDYSNMNK